MAQPLSESDKEAISQALDEFSRQPEEMCSVLEHYLNAIADTGMTLFPWSKLKPVLIHKLDVVTKEFHEKAPMIASERPNVESTTFEELYQRLLEMIQQFNGIPFTIQRLCELVTNPRKHYQRTEKFMRGVEKTLAVVTTIDPFGNRVVHESKTAMVNGLDAGRALTTPDAPATPTSGSDVRDDHHSISSPYIPPAPRNSPNSPAVINNSSSSTATSWFTSLSSVVDSPSSYPSSSTFPSWRTKDRSRGDSPDRESRDGDQYPEDPDSAPPPRKQAKLESQDSIDHADWTGSTSPCNPEQLGGGGKNGEEGSSPGAGIVFAPILGQLLGGKDVETILTPAVGVVSEGEAMEQEESVTPLAGVKEVVGGEGVASGIQIREGEIQKEEEMEGVDDYNRVNVVITTGSLTGNGLEASVPEQTSVGASHTHLSDVVESTNLVQVQREEPSTGVAAPVNNEVQGTSAVASGINTDNVVSATEPVNVPDHSTSVESVSTTQHPSTNIAQDDIVSVAPNSVVHDNIPNATSVLVNEADPYSNNEISQTTSEINQTSGNSTDFSEVMSENKGNVVAMPTSATVSSYDVKCDARPTPSDETQDKENVTALSEVKPEEKIRDVSSITPTSSLLSSSSSVTPGTTLLSTDSAAPTSSEVSPAVLGGQTSTLELNEKTLSVSGSDQGESSTAEVSKEDSKICSVVNSDAISDDTVSDPKNTLLRSVEESEIPVNDTAKEIPRDDSCVSSLPITSIENLQTPVEESVSSEPTRSTDCVETLASLTSVQPLPSSESVEPTAESEIKSSIVCSAEQPSIVSSEPDILVSVDAEVSAVDADISLSNVAKDSCDEVAMSAIVTNEMIASETDSTDVKEKTRVVSGGDESKRAVSNEEELMEAEEMISVKHDTSAIEQRTRDNNETLTATEPVTSSAMEAD